ncbi:MAG: nucleotidyltransferase family protein [Granulicella sp.]
MRWKNPGNRILAETIVATFSSPPEKSRRLLSSFSLKDWTTTEFWLDASGLALYFLEHVRATGLGDAVPQPVIQHLEQKLCDNKLRRETMFAEFTAINRLFSQEGIHYSNLKGFTLSPDSCPDSDLRFQIDFDFLIAPEDRDLCRSLLEKIGYLLTIATRLTWEFKAGTSKAIPKGGQYKSSQHRSVELHFTADETDAVDVARDLRLDRLGSWRGLPALSPADLMIAQAMHILAHVRSPVTRPSWLLEFRHHVITRQNDEFFWAELKRLAKFYALAPIALGLSVQLATDLFGSFSFPELDSWTVEQLPPRIKLWAEHYGRDVLFADIPGTKLYLLLEGELNPGERQPQRRTLRRLLPFQRVPRVMHSEPGDSLPTRIYQEYVQLRFILFRLRFHVQQGLLYSIEADRWKRVIASKFPACEPTVILSSRGAVMSQPLVPIKK